jgi:hypothetical protein
MTDEEKDDFDSSNDFDTSTISEFDFSGAIIRQKKLPLLERWPGGGPAYKLGGQRPDGSYVLAKDQSMGLLILNSNFDVVGEVQLHSFDGSPVRVGSLRGVDAAGNSYFGDSGYDTTPEARRFLKFNPEGELLWWSGSPLFPAAPDLQPVAPYPLPYDYYHATVDPNGTAVYLAGGGLTKLGVDGNVTTNGMTYTAGPEFGPDGYLYTAEFQQFPNLVVVRAWTTSMQPVFSFSLPEISRSAFAIAFSSTGDLYLRTESDVHRVDSSHNYLGMFAAPTRKFHPELAVMSDGNLLITTQDPEGKSYLRKLTSAGTVIWSKDDPGAAGLAVDAAGRIWLHTGQGVQVWDQDGNPLGGGTIIQAESSAGDGLPIAAHGNDVWFYCGGRVYIASAE